MTIAALNAAAAAVEVERSRIEVLANNVANANTTGFKASEVDTEDGFYNTLKKAGIQENADAGKRPIGAQIGSGARIAGIHRILTQGAFKTTNQPLDIAIAGAGYFAINIPTFPNGRGFTRDGSFKIDPDTGQIVTIRGEPLLDGITIPNGIDPSAVTIAKDGTVSYTDPATNAQNEIGRIQLWTFPNEKGLEEKGSNTLVETVGSGDALEVVDQNNRFLQNNLEMSNVSTVEMLTKLVAAQRAYELGVRFIKVADELEKEVNNIKS